MSLAVPDVAAFRLWSLRTVGSLYLYPLYPSLCSLAVVKSYHLSCALLNSPRLNSRPAPPHPSAAPQVAVANGYGAKDKRSQNVNMSLKHPVGANPASVDWTVCDGANRASLDWTF